MTTQRTGSQGSWEVPGDPPSRCRRHPRDGNSARAHGEWHRRDPAAAQAGVHRSFFEGSAANGCRRCVQAGRPGNANGSRLPMRKHFTAGLLALSSGRIGTTTIFSDAGDHHFRPPISSRHHEQRTIVRQSSLHLASAMLPNAHQPWSPPPAGKAPRVVELCHDDPRDRGSIRRQNRKAPAARRQAPASSCRPADLPLADRPTADGPNSCEAKPHPPADP